MSRGPVALLGRPEATGPARAALEAAGFEPVAFEDVGAFTQAVLAGAPRAVVVWDDLPSGALDVAVDVVRHHFTASGCGIVRVRRGGGSPETDSRVHAELDAPPDLDRLVAAVVESTGGGRGEQGRIPQILVVDDDPNIVLLGSHIVTGMGMIPMAAFDGPEAVEKARRFLPDLILLDINMPGMDGFQVIETLKAEVQTHLTPIIVFSARRDDLDKVRALELGADDYVTKPFSLTELSARIDRLLKRTRADMSASSTTGLPGSVTVEQVLSERLRAGGPLAVLYADVDHFKAFNDRYGFGRGDSVLRQVADLMVEAVQAHGNGEDLVGHIGGDDFVVVTTPDRAEAVAQGMIDRFDRVMPYYYDAADREAGQIRTMDRRGRPVTYPLMTLSVAIVTNENRPLEHPAQVSDVAAQLKKYAKARPVSLWVKDKRG